MEGTDMVGMEEGTVGTEGMAAVDTVAVATAAEAVAAGVIDLVSGKSQLTK